MPIFTRRNMIGATGSAVVVAGAAYGAGLTLCSSQTALRADLPLERLDVGLSQMRAPEKVGAAWRAAHTRKTTEAQLYARPLLMEALATDCPESRRARFRTAFQADFAAGDTVLADGWVVSRSECLVAALGNTTA